MNVNFLHGRTYNADIQLPGGIEEIIPSAGHLKFLPGGPVRRGYIPGFISVILHNWISGDSICLIVNQMFQSITCCHRYCMHFDTFFDK